MSQAARRRRRVVSGLYARKTRSVSYASAPGYIAGYIYPQDAERASNGKSDDQLRVYSSAFVLSWLSPKGLQLARARERVFPLLITKCRRAAAAARFINSTGSADYGAGRARELARGALRYIENAREIKFLRARWCNANCALGRWIFRPSYCYI